MELFHKIKNKKKHYGVIVVESLRFLQLITHLIQILIQTHIYIYITLSNVIPSDSKQCYYTITWCWIHILKIQPLNYMFYMFLTCMLIFMLIYIYIYIVC